jgi:hypothetical protein
MRYNNYTNIAVYRQYKRRSRLPAAIINASQKCGAFVVFSIYCAERKTKKVTK